MFYWQYATVSVVGIFGYFLKTEHTHLYRLDGHFSNVLESFDYSLKGRGSYFTALVSI